MFVLSAFRVMLPFWMSIPVLLSLSVMSLVDADTVDMFPLMSVICLSHSLPLSFNVDTSPSTVCTLVLIWSLTVSVAAASKVIVTSRASTMSRPFVNITEILFGGCGMVW